MKKILIIHPSMVGGGAEKVLINMLNSFDYNKYDVTLLSLIDEGINKKFINKNVKYKYVFKKHIKGYRHFLKLFSPKFLFKKMVKDKYDTIISYLEGPTTRILSGCNYKTNLISWIHTENTTCFKIAFRSKKEMIKAYNRINKIVCVSSDVKKSFSNFTEGLFDSKTTIIKNVNNPDDIIKKSKKACDELNSNSFNIIAIGRLDNNKDHARLIPIIEKLNSERLDAKLFILGMGEEFNNIKQKIEEYDMGKKVKLMGYQVNPYKFLAKADLYVCCSHYEGYSTTTIESLILNIPILTTNCSGMKEILDNGKYGIIVDDNDEEIYENIKEIIKDKNKYTKLKLNQKEKISLLYEEYDSIVNEINSIL